MVKVMTTLFTSTITLALKPFEFSSVCAEKVKSMLDDIDSSKATGFDNIPAKWLKSTSHELAQPVTTLVN